MEFVKKYYAMGIVLGVFLWALYQVASYRMQESPPGVTILRIGHWQLETGVRDGFNELAKEYQKLHPNVRIIQDAIPESVYGQWMSTQFLAGTMSDIVEMGLGLPYQVLLSYYNRYWRSDHAIRQPSQSLQQGDRTGEHAVARDLPGRDDHRLQSRDAGIHDSAALRFATVCSTTRIF